jgi:rSAM/selenodomain-associated transferase 2
LNDPQIFLKSQQMKVSIIVPVLNEEETITSALQHLQTYRQQGHEVIIVDGGSDDNTVARTHGLVDKILKSKCGRAFQMNTGAEYASGEVLLFLHADTVLPAKACLLITDIIAKGKEWGRFDVRLSGQSWLFRIIERMMNLRSYLTSIATGDQAIFVRKSLFSKIGAYPEIQLMEDVALCRKLRNRNKPACLKDRVITSSRKWESNGIIRTVIFMWRLRLMYYLGVPADTLARKYYGKYYR